MHGYSYMRDSLWASGGASENSHYTYNYVFVAFTWTYNVMIPVGSASVRTNVVLNPREY